MRKNIVTMIIGTIVFIIAVIALINSTAIFDPEDTTAADIEKKKHMESTVEGAFLDADGNIIFAPEKNYNEDKTELPLPYSYILGYNSPMYGATGLREQYYKHLYNDKDTGTGGSIQLTIDTVLQNKAYSMLKDHNLAGSIVVLNAKNAEILAMAGRRNVDYDVSNLTAEKWAKYNDGSVEGILLSPATGDYKAPGSVFKILTAAAAIKNGMRDFVFDDEGNQIVVDGYTITNAYSTDYGPETLQSALTHSSNTYFGTLSLELGEKAMKSIFNDFLVGQKIDLGFAVLNSAGNLNGSDKNLAMVGFGQGGVAISPLHMAMIGQSFVNNGKMVKPTLIKALYDANGITIFSNTEHELLTQTVKPDIANEVKELMNGVAKEKYPDWLYTDKIYCKTGTAQIKEGVQIYNSYFLCMTDDYVILISINNTPDFGGDFSYIAESFLSELY